MRSNMPVTHVEYVMKDTETVVSKTDLHGNITYVNQDFINISGYSEEELIGAPQNIVRHPDMPEEAFADFWRTLKSGKAWTGLVPLVRGAAGVLELPIGTIERSETVVGDLVALEAIEPG